MRCKYWKVCPEYQEDSVMCNKENGSWEFGKKCNTYTNLHNRACDRIDLIRAIVGIALLFYTMAFLGFR